MFTSYTQIGNAPNLAEKMKKKNFSVYLIVVEFLAMKKAKGNLKIDQVHPLDLY